MAAALVTTCQTNQVASLKHIIISSSISVLVNDRTTSLEIAEFGHARHDTLKLPL
jgi:hypothetical protein